MALASLPDFDKKPKDEGLRATGTAAGDEMQDPHLLPYLLHGGAGQCLTKTPGTKVWRRRRDLNPGSVARRQFSKLLH